MYCIILNTDHSAAVEELLSNDKYKGTIVVRAVFRSEERAAALRAAHGDR